MLQMKRSLKRIGAMHLALLLSAAATAAEPAKPLFASDQMIRVTISGPISAIAQRAEGSTEPHAATLSVGAAETDPIILSARGNARRNTEVCQFPPLRVTFTTPPAATSPFRGQKRLKLVTHCRQSAGFQQHLLLEYAAYRMFNVLSPTGFHARLATVDYTDPNGRPVISRLGFFLEDADDAAKRAGLYEVKTGDRIAVSQLNPRDSARLAVFEYMLGNLDWSTRAGTAGTGCCHNAKLLGATKTQISNLIPIPYDFDYSGFVGAPYALPPEGIPVNSVKRRYYRGWCAHNGEALAVAAEMRGQRGAVLAALGQVPQLDERTRRSAAAYLDGFFNDIATDQDIRAKLLKTCIN
jgi:hypothetical protein